MIFPCHVNNAFFWYNFMKWKAANRSKVPVNVVASYLGASKTERRFVVVTCESNTLDLLVACFNLLV